MMGVALKPSLAGEGGGELKIDCFFLFFLFLEIKNKAFYKRELFDFSSPNPLGNSSCIALLTYNSVGIQQQRA